VTSDYFGLYNLLLFCFKKRKWGLELFALGTLGYGIRQYWHEIGKWGLELSILGTLGYGIRHIDMGSDSLMEKMGWCKHFFFSSCAVHFRSSISSVPMRKKKSGFTF